MLRIARIASLALVLAAPATAQSTQPDVRGFGLHDLRWGMSNAQAKDVYPVLRAPPSNAVLNQTDLRLPALEFGGCTFTVALWFEADKLVRVVVDRHPAEPIAKCAAVLKREMQTQYSAITASRTTKDGNLEWSGAVTTATYIDLLQYGGRAEIKKTGSASLITYDVLPANR